MAALKAVSLLFSLVLFGYIDGSSAQSGDAYIDNVIFSALRSDIIHSYLDPAALGNFTSDFKAKMVVTINGKANYHSGKLTNLSSVRRQGRCSGPALVYNNITLDCGLTFDKLNVEYKAKLTAGVSTTITAVANLTSVIANIQLTSSRYNNHPIVKSVEVPYMKVTKTKFTGLGPFNSSLKSLENDFIQKVTNQVIYIIRMYFKDSLQRSIAYFPLPTPWLY